MYELPTIKCPAGDRIEETADGPGCRCRLERNSLLARRDPSSLRSYCLGRYDACPTWRKEKVRQWIAQRDGIADKDPTEGDEAGLAGMLR